MIRNIVFDIGNVLIGFEWEEYILSLFDKETAYKVGRAMFLSGYWIELDRAVIPVDEIVELFCSSEPDLRDEIHEAFDRVGACIKKLDWVIPYLKTLKEKGYSLYYLSNMSEHIIHSNEEAFRFTDYMDGGVYSCHVHQIKPDKEIYETLIDRFDLIPEECVFIDDHRENTQVAESLGMKSVVFSGREQMQAELEELLG